MKKVIIIFFSTLFISNLVYISPFAQDLDYLEQQLDKLGIEEQYCDNIIDYISNTKLTSEQISDIKEDGLEVFNTASEMNSDGLSLSELITIYNEATSIAKDLNIDIGINFVSQSIILKNKNNGDTLFKCNKDEVPTYYNKFKAMNINKDYCFSLLNYLQEDVVADDTIEENNINDKSEEEYDYKKKDKSYNKEYVKNNSSKKDDYNINIDNKNNDDSIASDGKDKENNNLTQDTTKNVINKSLSILKNSKGIDIIILILIVGIVIKLIKRIKK